MFAWIADNLVTIAVSALLLAAVVIAVISLVRGKKHCSCGCTGNCASCGACCGAKSKRS